MENGCGPGANSGSGDFDGSKCNSDLIAAARNGLGKGKRAKSNAPDKRINSSLHGGVR